MRLSCDGNLNDSFITRLLLSPLLKNFENRQHLAKLWARLGCPVFCLSHGVKRMDAADRPMCLSLEGLRSKVMYLPPDGLT